MVSSIQKQLLEIPYIIKCLNPRPKQSGTIRPNKIVNHGHLNQKWPEIDQWPTHIQFTFIESPMAIINETKQTQDKHVATAMQRDVYKLQD